MQTPNLSVLLAIKGLVPLEADCADAVISANAERTLVRRFYRHNPAFYRDIALPYGCIHDYEYHLDASIVVFAYNEAKGEYKVTLR